MSIVVRLGNANPQMQDIRPIVQGGEVVGTEQISVPAEHLNQSITTIEFHDGVDDAEAVEHSLSTDNDRLLSMIARGLGDGYRKYAVAVRDVEDILAVHAGGAKPDWVDSDNVEIALALGQHFACPVGEPTALLTTVGRDALHAQHLSTSAQPASFNYGALSANATAESAANTTLPGEITTGGGGLIRAQMTYAHTTGTNTATLTKTWTANGSDSLPVVIAKIGVLNASSVGTLGYEKLLSATATLTSSGDSVTVTFTDTIG